MIADIMLLQSRDDVRTASPLQNARFFSHHLERRSNAALGQQFCQPLRSIIVRGQQIILGVKPENDIDLRVDLAFRRGQTKRKANHR